MTIHFFRDSLTLDDTLFERLAKAGIETHPGDTLVLGAANCTLTSLSPAFSYVILAGSGVGAGLGVPGAGAAPPGAGVIVRSSPAVHSCVRESQRVNSRLPERLKIRARRRSVPAAPSPETRPAKRTR